MLTRGWIEVDGYRLGTLLADPQIAERAPALLYLPSLGGRSLDVALTSPGEAMALVLAEAARANMVTLRVQPSGYGGSGGPGDSQVGLDEQVRAYRAALRMLRQHPGVDPAAVVLFGHSLGGALVPLVAREPGVRGAVVYGAPSRPWSETLSAAASRQLRLAQLPEEQIAAEVACAAALYRGLLCEQRSAEQLFAAQPELRNCVAARDVQGDQLHGRSLAFFRALEQQPPEAAWRSAALPVLALAGQHDWVVAPDDHERIAAFVRAAAQPAAAHTVASVDHDMRRYPSAEQSFRQRGSGPLDPAAAQLAIGWIGALVGRPLPSER